MKTLNANFTAYKNYKTSAPVTLAVFHLTGGVQYVSDRDVAASGDMPAYMGLITSWGGITEGAGGPYRVGLSETAIEIANTASSPFSGLLDGGDPEGAEVELFQWFEGMSYSDKMPIGKYVISSPVVATETSVRIRLVSGFVKRNRIVGRAIGLDEYPGADPDSVGRVESIVYGSLTNLPCPAVVAGGYSTLISDITAAATSLEISGSACEAAFPAAPFTVQVDKEQLRVTSKGASPYRVWTVTRGYGGTTAAVHKKGARAWEVRSDYTFLVAGHPVKSIGDVYVGGVRVTSGVTKKTNDSGKAKLVFSDRFTLEKSVDLSVSQGSHGHAAGTSSKRFYGSPFTMTGAGQNHWYTDCCSVNAGANLGAIISVTLHVTMRDVLIQAGSDPQFHIRGTGLSDTSTHFPANQGYQSISRSFGTTISSWGTWNIDCEAASGLMDQTSPASYPAIDEVYWDVEYTSNTSSDAAAGVTLSGNSAADMVVGGPVTCNVDGYADDGSGTYTGAPNALIENPADVIRHFLVNQMGMTASEVDASFTVARAALSGAVSGGYKFAGAITKAADGLGLLEELSSQSRLRLSHDGYSARLRFMSSPPFAPVKSIDPSIIKMDSVRVTRTGRDELINKLDIHYRRDYTKGGNQPGDYMSLACASALYPREGDPASVAAYGPRTLKRPCLFGFVSGDAVAQDLREFCITRYKYVKRRVTFTIYLDNLELEPGDVIGIEYASPAFDLTGSVYTVEVVTLTPGSAVRSRPDEILIQAREV